MGSVDIDDGTVGATAATAGVADPKGQIALKAIDVSIAFGGVKAVDGMSLALRRGSITALIGANGAGKSTFFHLLSGVLQPTHGTVRLFGDDITRLPMHERTRRGMVRSFQLARELGRLTVLENLMLAAQGQLGERLLPVFLQVRRIQAEQREIHRRALEVLELSRLAVVKDELAVNLSGGQKKLLEIGRALMTGCDVILLDEPGAGVNPALMGLLTEMIRRLNVEHGKTFLIVEHDMDLVARLCDPVIVMAEGRRLMEGRFEDVRRDPRVIEAYLGGPVHA